jgi:hypothetical protein
MHVCQADTPTSFSDLIVKLHAHDGSSRTYHTHKAIVAMGDCGSAYLRKMLEVPTGFSSVII